MNDSKNSKALVIGGSGFLGSHVADILTANGYDVTIFDKKKSTYLKSQQKMVIGDILDEKMILNYTKDVKYVYHFAGIADIHKAQQNPIETVKNNVLATTYILDACRHNKVNRIIYASSVYVYSDQG